MQPSNFSRIGRRRSNSKENQLDVQSEDGGKTIKSDPLPRSRSGPNLAENDTSTLKLPQNHCNTYRQNPSGLTTQDLQPDINGTRISDTDTSERTRHRSGSWTGVNESDEDMDQMPRAEVSPLVQVLNSQSLDESIPSLYTENSNYGSYQNHFNSYSSDNTIAHNPERCNEEAIKRKLKFFFMNPFEKWHARRRVPWKLGIQIIKIIICTAQLCMFASQRYSHVTYLWDTKVSFSHLFIKGWDSSREVTAYPPSTGPLAIYEIEDFFKFLDHSVNMFSTVEETAIGAYKYDKVNGTTIMPKLCFTQFDHGPSLLDNVIYIENTKNKFCFDIPSSILNSTKSWSSKEFLANNSVRLNFDLLLEVTYSFSLKTLKLRSDYPFDVPECYSLETLIYFDNNDHDGQMLVELDIAAKVLDCNSTVNLRSNDPHFNSLREYINLSTIIICIVSFIMCLRAIIRAQILKKAVNKSFVARFGRPLSSWERFEFINLWYVLICVNDFLITIGSIIKMGLEGQDYEGYLDKWNVCSLLLGTGNLFIWFGCLRYLGFFETYNVLILTIKRCFPNVLRYSICILMVFAGYSLCGWLVLGPYHIKFRSLSTTTECLYSLINGDDMFATFSSTIGKDSIVWWFSRIYLYTFISLFIYVILSLFIAIITDAYDTIKRYYEEGFPVSQLMAFANECRADPCSGVFHEDERTIQDFVNYVCCCCPNRARARRSSSIGYEVIPS